MVNRQRGLLALALWLCATLVQAEIRVEVDRDPVSQNETVQINFVATGQVDGEPDFAPLSVDFEILGTAQSTQISSSNGQYTAETRWTVQVLPRKIGVLTIPSVAFGSSASAARTLTVKLPAPGSPGQAGSEVFLEVETSAGKPYVQSEVVLTVRIFAAVRTGNARLTEPLLSGVDVVLQRTAADRSYEARRDGRSYRVTERNYSLFPQASGRLNIGAMLFSAEIGDNRLPWQDPFRRGQIVRVGSKPIDLEVRPIPPGFPGDVWLPARSVSLAAGWSPANPAFRVGEPATLTVSMTAVGLAASQLPPPALALPDGLRQYADAPVSDERWTGRNTVAEQNSRVAIIPGAAGRFEIPGLSVPWWNVDTDTLEYARLEPVAFVAEPSADSVSTEPEGAPETAASAAEDGESGSLSVSARGGVWRWLALGLAFGWAATLGLWWYSRRPSVTADTASVGLAAARRRVRRAASRGEARETGEALLAWAAAVWPERPPRSLSALGRRSGEPLASALAGLERALYADGEHEWDGEELARAVAAFAPSGEPRSESGEELAPLYPGYRERESGRTAGRSAVS